MRTLYLILTAVIAYVLGSINGAIIAGRFVFHKDVRSYGSGNAGLTNYYRNFGTPGMVLLVLIDVLKTVAAVLIGGALLNLAEAREVGMLFAGFCAILGHMFPAYYQFRGGKGVLVGVSTFLVVDPKVFIALLAIFVVILALSKYVSMASIISSGYCPLATLLMTWVVEQQSFGRSILYAVLSIPMVALIIWMHRPNMERLRDGTENKFSFRMSENSIN